LLHNHQQRWVVANATATAAATTFRQHVFRLFLWPRVTFHRQLKSAEPRQEIGQSDHVYIDTYRVYRKKQKKRQRQQTYNGNRRTNGCTVMAIGKVASCKNQTKWHKNSERATATATTANCNWPKTASKNEKKRSILQTE